MTGAISAWDIRFYIKSKFMKTVCMMMVIIAMLLNTFYEKTKKGTMIIRKKNFWEWLGK